MYHEVHDHLREKLEIGAIQLTHCPWTSPFMLVQKKYGKLWFCIDLQELNARMVKDMYSLPRIEDTLDCLNGTV